MQKLIGPALKDWQLTEGGGLSELDAALAAFMGSIA